MTAVSVFGRSSAYSAGAPISCICDVTHADAAAHAPCFAFATERKDGIHVFTAQGVPVTRVETLHPRVRLLCHVSALGALASVEEGDGDPRGGRGAGGAASSGLYLCVYHNWRSAGARRGSVRWAYSLPLGQTTPVVSLAACGVTGRLAVTDGREVRLFSVDRGPLELAATLSVPWASSERLTHVALHGPYVALASASHVVVAFADVFHRVERRAAGERKGGVGVGGGGVGGGGEGDGDREGEAGENEDEENDGVRDDGEQDEAVVWDVDGETGSHLVRQGDRLMSLPGPRATPAGVEDDVGRVGADSPGERIGRMRAPWRTLRPSRATGWRSGPHGCWIVLRRVLGRDDHVVSLAFFRATDLGGGGGVGVGSGTSSRSVAAAAAGGVGAVGVPAQARAAASASPAPAQWLPKGLVVFSARSGFVYHFTSGLGRALGSDSSGSNLGAGGHVAAVHRLGASVYGAPATRARALDVASADVAAHAVLDATIGAQLPLPVVADDEIEALNAPIAAGLWRHRVVGWLRSWSERQDVHWSNGRWSAGGQDVGSVDVGKAGEDARTPWQRRGGDGPKFALPTLSRPDGRPRLASAAPAFARPSPHPDPELPKPMATYQWALPAVAAALAGGVVVVLSPLGTLECFALPARQYSAWGHLVHHPRLSLQPIADSEGFGVLAASARFTHVLALGSPTALASPTAAPSILLCHLGAALDPVGRLAALLDSSRLFAERLTFDIRDAARRAARRKARRQTRGDRGVLGDSAAATATAAAAGPSSALAHRRSVAAIKAKGAERPGTAPGTADAADGERVEENNIVRKASMLSLDLLFDDNDEEEQAREDEEGVDAGMPLEDEAEEQPSPMSVRSAGGEERVLRAEQAGQTQQGVQQGVHGSSSASSLSSGAAAAAAAAVQEMEAASRASRALLVRIAIAPPSQIATDILIRLAPDLVPADGTWDASAPPTLATTSSVEREAMLESALAFAQGCDCSVRVHRAAWIATAREQLLARVAFLRLSLVAHTCRSLVAKGRDSDPVVRAAFEACVQRLRSGRERDVNLVAEPSAPVPWLQAAARAAARAMGNANEVAVEAILRRELSRIPALANPRQTLGLAPSVVLPLPSRSQRRDILQLYTSTSTGGSAIPSPLLSSSSSSSTSASAPSTSTSTSTPSSSTSGRWEASVTPMSWLMQLSAALHAARGADSVEAVAAVAFPAATLEGSVRQRISVAEVVAATVVELAATGRAGVVGADAASTRRRLALCTRSHPLALPLALATAPDDQDGGGGMDLETVALLREALNSQLVLHAPSTIGRARDADARAIASIVHQLTEATAPTAPEPHSSEPHSSEPHSSEPHSPPPSSSSWSVPAPLVVVLHALARAQLGSLAASDVCLPRLLRGSPTLVATAVASLPTAWGLLVRPNGAMRAVARECPTAVLELLSALAVFACADAGATVAHTQSSSGILHAWGPVGGAEPDLRLARASATAEAASDGTRRSDGAEQDEGEGEGDLARVRFRVSAAAAWGVGVANILDALSVPPALARRAVAHAPCVDGAGCAALADELDWWRRAATVSLDPELFHDSDSDDSADGYEGKVMERPASRRLLALAAPLHGAAHGAGELAAHLDPADPPEVADAAREWASVRRLAALVALWRRCLRESSARRAGGAGGAGGGAGGGGVGGVERSDEGVRGEACLLAAGLASLLLARGPDVMLGAGAGLEMVARELLRLPWPASQADGSGVSGSGSGGEWSESWALETATVLQSLLPLPRWLQYLVGRTGSPRLTAALTILWALPRAAAARLCDEVVTWTTTHPDLTDANARRAIRCLRAARVQDNLAPAALAAVAASPGAHGSGSGLPIAAMAAADLVVALIMNGDHAAPPLITSRTPDHASVTGSTPGDSVAADSTLADQEFLPASTMDADVRATAASVAQALGAVVVDALARGPALRGTEALHAADCAQALDRVLAAVANQGSPHDLRACVPPKLPFVATAPYIRSALRQRILDMSAELLAAQADPLPA